MGVPYAAGGPNPGDANTGDVNGFHAIAHRNVADKVLCDTWFAQMNGYIIGLMKGITDANGASMLDSSVFVGMNNMRAGLARHNEPGSVPFSRFRPAERKERDIRQQHGARIQKPEQRRGTGPGLGAQSIQ